ncbi:hypothetical protein BDZ89DRAFT_664081 [Hymenopellis radicata]|nr:hypothetical protein BDZ89DRAFT_664081 [Hymenopellis radicata]
MLRCRTYNTSPDALLTPAVVARDILPHIHPNSLAYKDLKLAFITTTPTPRAPVVTASDGARFHPLRHGAPVVDWRTQPYPAITSAITSAAAIALYRARWSVSNRTLRTFPRHMSPFEMHSLGDALFLVWAFYFLVCVPKIVFWQFSGLIV